MSQPRAHASSDAARRGTLAAIAAALTLLSTPAAHASPQARLVYGRSGAAVEDVTPPASEHSERPATVPPKSRIGLALRGSLDLNPGPAAGVSLYVGAAWKRFSIGLEAQADFPSTATAIPPNSGSTVTAWLVSGALVPGALASF